VKRAVAEGWRRLYGAAGAFAALGPWRWMADSDIFGVRDPASGEVGWCAVLGARDEVLGVNVYWGDEGHATWEMMQRGRLPRREILSHLDGLLFTMDDRGELDEHDLATIKSLGLRFRGSRQWPCFRSLRPGHLPWHLEEDEIAALTLILEQATDVCARAKDGRDLFAAKAGEGLLLVRDRGRATEADAPWRDSWESAPRWIPPKPLPPPVPDEAIRPLLAKCRPAVARWEFGNTPISGIVREPGQRPFHPRATLVVDASSGMILHLGLGSGQFKAEEVQAELLRALETTRTIPARITARGEEVAACLEPIAKAIGARLEQATDLPALDEALAGMDDYLGAP